MPRAKLTRSLEAAYRRVAAGEDTYLYDRHPVAGSWGIGWNESAAAWQAALFASQYHGRRGVDVRRLEALVLRVEDAPCAYFFAKRVPGADVAALRRHVEAHGSEALVRAFHKNISARKA